PDCRSYSRYRVRSPNSIVYSPTASPRVKWTCGRPGLPLICGRPRWTSSRSTSRTMRRIGESLRISSDLQKPIRHSGAERSDEPGIHNHDREYGFRACAKRAHPGMTKAVILVTPQLLPHPFRRTLFRKCLRPLDKILRRRHRLHGGIVALVGDRLL